MYKVEYVIVLNIFILVMLCCSIMEDSDGESKVEDLEEANQKCAYM